MHCNLLRGLGMSRRKATRLPWTITSPTCRNLIEALLDFAVKLGVRFFGVLWEDIVNLRTFGFADEQILDVRWS